MIEQKGLATIADGNRSDMELRKKRQQVIEVH